MISWLVAYEVFCRCGAGVARRGTLLSAKWRAHSALRGAIEALATASTLSLTRPRSRPHRATHASVIYLHCALCGCPLRRLKHTLEFKVQLEKQVAQYKNMVAFLQAEVSSLSRERDALKTNLQVGESLQRARVRKMSPDAHVKGFP